MKSIRKRFKKKLQAIERSALELELLSIDLPFVEAMLSLVNKVLALCSHLNAQSVELDKSEFVEMIQQNKCLLALDDLADVDVISELEEAFSVICGECHQDQLGEFVGQFLEKLEKRHAIMTKDIRELGRLLAESD